MAAPMRYASSRSSPRKRGPSWIPACAGMSGCCASAQSSFASGGKPRRDLLHQRLAQAGMFDALDRLAEEGLDQQGLGFRRRDAARHQVELELLVKRACGGAVAALHVVGKDLELRLVVGLGAIGKEKRLRHHLG